MEMSPQKQGAEMQNYARFLNLEDCDIDLVINKCKNDPKFKDTTIFNLKQKLREQQNPELVDENYRKTQDAVFSGLNILEDISILSEQLTEQFIQENLADKIMVFDLNHSELLDFCQKTLDFFDKRLSPTLLGLAGDDFPFLKENLPIVREKILKTIKNIESNEFYKIPKDPEKIDAFKERLTLIENL